MTWERSRRPSRLSLGRRESGRKEGRLAQPVGHNHPTPARHCSQAPLEAKAGSVGTIAEAPSRLGQSPQGSHLWSLATLG